MRPTFSMSPVRMHFWQVAARVNLGSPSPRNSRLNWFIPAGVNNTVGSFGTSTSLGRRTHPLDSKNSRNASRKLVYFHLTVTCPRSVSRMTGPSLWATALANSRGVRTTSSPTLLINCPRLIPAAAAEDPSSTSTTTTPEVGALG